MNTYKITWSDFDGRGFVYMADAESEGEALELFELEIESRYHADIISIKEVVAL